MLMCSLYLLVSFTPQFYRVFGTPVVPCSAVRYWSWYTKESIVSLSEHRSWPGFSSESSRAIHVDRSRHMDVRSVKFVRSMSEVQQNCHGCRSFQRLVRIQGTWYR